MYSNSMFELAGEVPAQDWILAILTWYSDVRQKIISLGYESSVKSAKRNLRWFIYCRGL